MTNRNVSEDFRIEFSLDHPKFDLKPPATAGEIAILEEKLACPLPPSFRWWLRQHRESVFDIGNLLSLHSATDHVNQFSIYGATKWYQQNKHCQLKDIIVFGMTGVDSETFAFYTGLHDPGGEYPVIWITPGSLGGEAFVLCNSRFDRFLNIHVKMLLKSEEEDMGDAEFKNLFEKLFRIHDPGIQLKSNDFYELAVSAEQLQSQARQLFSAEHR